MKKLQRGFTLVEGFTVFMFAAVVLGIGGWIANIVKLVGMDFAHITGMLVVRGLGVIVPPLGAVLGFF
jgi:hypothetical protein